MTENICLKFDDFHYKLKKSISNLRLEKDFIDVTLVSEDEIEISAHKVILASNSEYFKKILMKNKNQHPWLCLSGIYSKDLAYVIDYIYNGEVKVYQDDIDRFLVIAQKLKLDGLIFNQKQQLLEKSNELNVVPNKQQFMKVKPMSELSQEDEEMIDQKHLKPLKNTMEMNNIDTKAESEKNKNSVLVSVDSPQIQAYSDLSNLDNLISNNLGRNTNGLYFCNLCGKQSGIKNGKQNMRNHIETHLVGMTFTCNVCNKPYRTRHTLEQHMYVYHNTRKNK